MGFTHGYEYSTTPWLYHIVGAIGYCCFNFIGKILFGALHCNLRL
jgi:hypothetical protein